MTLPYRLSAIEGARGELKLSPALQAELSRALEPGERVLVSRRPNRERLRMRAIASLGFPLVWNGFVIALIVLAAKHDAAVYLGAVPLLAMGIPLFGVPIAAWRAIATTFYAVTDRRVLVFDRDEVVSVGDVSHVVDVLR
jgi:hypothetical protein